MIVQFTSGPVPDYAPFGGIGEFERTVIIAGKCIGEWSGSLPFPGLTQYTGKFPPSETKSSYTGPGFYQSLSTAERELLINKSKSSDAAGAIFESIKLNGLDFNQSSDLDIGDRMVLAGILTQTSLDELVG